MDGSKHISLINSLRIMPTETEWFEFKRSRCSSPHIGEYLSALANSACLAGQPFGYLIIGIDDESHNVIGTSFDPYAAKGKGNQDLLPWLAAGLRPNSGFELHIIKHPDGRVVLFEIGPAQNQPVSFYGNAYVRIGSSLTELSKHPEKARSIWARGRDWSGDVCEMASLDDLDPEALEKAREQFIVKHQAQEGDIKGWDDVTFLNKAKVLKHGLVTYTALVLLGKSESATLISPAVAKISWVLKDYNNRELDYEHFGPPFILVGDHLQSRIRNLIVRALPSGTLFPKEITQYDPWVIREALHNCIAHQDYGLYGRITVVETPDSVLMNNLGSFLPGDIETVIRQDAPQETYRNPFLADAMVELNMIDTQGGGIKRMFETQRARWFPLPDYDLAKPNRVAVSVAGRILDEKYTKILMENSEVELEDVIQLDKVQKGHRIGKRVHRRLKKAGWVEGRYPNLMVAGVIAKATGETGRHIRERGFNKQYYLDLIVALVGKHGPVSRGDVDDVLLPKLPDRFDAVQKKRKVQNLLQELRRSGIIFNSGTRANSKWVLKGALSD